MLSVLIGVLVGVVFGALAGGRVSRWALNQQQTNVLSSEHLLAETAISRQFELGQLKAEVRRDAASARRALRAELNALDGRERL